MENKLNYSVADYMASGKGTSENEALLHGQIIGTLMLQGDITFKAFSKINPTVDVEVKSSCFTDKSFFISVYDDEWNSGPGETVRRELLDLLLSGDISFDPDFIGCEVMV